MKCRGGRVQKVVVAMFQGRHVLRWRLDRQAFLIFPCRGIEAIKFDETPKPGAVGGRRFFASLLIAMLVVMAKITPTMAHPHILAEARLEIVVDGTGEVERLKHLWRFDEFFSSTVILEFGAVGRTELNEEELSAVSRTIHSSLADFNYFQTVLFSGKELTMRPPTEFQVYFDDRQLIVAFEAEPRDPLLLRGSFTFGVYDPTLFTAIEFQEDEHIAIRRLPANCDTVVVRPDPFDVIAENQDSLTEDFFNDTTDYAAISATRLEVACPPEPE